VNLLQSANTALLQCDSKIKDALGYSRWGAHLLPSLFILFLMLTGLSRRYVGRRRVRSLSASKAKSDVHLGRMSDMMERNALSMAEGLSLQVETFVQQAILTSPSVKPIGKINIAHGCVTCPSFSSSLLCYVLTYLDCSSILSDIIFDNVFSDIAFHSLYPLFPSHSRELTILFRQDQGVRA
jgi:hypothetical protein